MTRINLVPVSELSDQHLLAEHREIVRVPNCLKSGRLSRENAPSEYVMGTGHVKFFADKLDFLATRYESIYAECRARGFSVQYMGSAFGLEGFSGCRYVPDEKAVSLSRSRLEEKLAMKPRFYRWTEATAKNLLR